MVTGRMTPEEQAEVIKKQKAIKKEQCAKVKAILMTPFEKRLAKRLNARLHNAKLKYEESNPGAVIDDDDDDASNSDTESTTTSTARGTKRNQPPNNNANKTTSTNTKGPPTKKQRTIITKDGSTNVPVPFVL